MKEFVKIAFRKITRMLKNIKIVKRSDPPCLNTFCKLILEILKARIPCSTELLFVVCER